MGSKEEKANCLAGEEEAEDINCLTFCEKNDLFDERSENSNKKNFSLLSVWFGGRVSCLAGRGRGFEARQHSVALASVLLDGHLSY